MGRRQKEEYWAEMRLSAKEMNQAAQLEVFRSLTVDQAVKMLGDLLDDGRRLRPVDKDWIYK